MISKLKHIVLWLLALFVAMLLQRCANAVAPTGGPKDTTPPVVVESVPENRSTAFSGQKIEIRFDEYVSLENANQNVLFSPPLATKPDIKLKGKTLVIRFKESLQPNTTYTIHFGEAIKDLHEGNVFKNFVYSFSTGHHIDTLSIAGVVLNANDKQPVEKAYVGLYAADRDHLDSLPMTTAPNYITKTDKEGRFRLEGLANKDYLVFALKDVNANLFFDLPNQRGGRFFGQSRPPQRFHPAFPVSFCPNRLHANAVGKKARRRRLAALCLSPSRPRCRRHDTRNVARQLQFSDPDFV